MAATHSKPLYSRIDGGESAHTTATSAAVELQSLHHDGHKSKRDKHDTQITRVTNQRLFPFQGAVALLFIVLLTAAAVGVLLASRGSPIEQWTVGKVQVRPQVWLSVLSTIMDGLTMFAVAKAAELTYWRAAARGTTLRRMYDLYGSQTIMGAIKNLFHLRGDRLSVVSVLCLVSALRGPLFQRASMVEGNATRMTVGTQELRVAQLVPPNFLFWESTGNLFDVVYNAYLERAPIHANTTGSGKDCGDLCKGKVKVCSLVHF